MFDRGQRDMSASCCTPAGRAIISGRAPGRLHLHLHAILLQQVHRPAGRLELRVLLQVTTPSSDQSHPHTEVECVRFDVSAYKRAVWTHQNTLRLLLRLMLRLLVVVVMAHGDMELPWCGTCSWHYWMMLTLMLVLLTINPKT
jgi:hypothetical protein